MAKTAIFVGHGLETAERRHQLAEEAYRRGLSDYRRVLEAQTRLFEQRFLDEFGLVVHQHLFVDDALQ